LSDDDSVLEEIWNSQHSLEELVAPEQFKSYDDLKARFSLTMGVSSSYEASSESAFDGTPERTPVAAPEVDSDEDDDNSLSYFKKLAEEV
jgi:hypothetical protein